MSVPLSLPALAGEDHDCTPCAFSYPAVTVESALGQIRMTPGRVGDAIHRVGDEDLRRRPSDGTWSALEYLCHLRDVYAVYTIRLYRTRVEEVPVLEPMLNDLRAARFRYNQRDVRPVLAELSDNVGGLLEEAAKNTSATWERVARRLPGEERTARWLVRQVAHEGVHHLRDIKRVLGR